MTASAPFPPPACGGRSGGGRVESSAPPPAVGLTRLDVESSLAPGQRPPARGGGRTLAVCVLALLSVCGGAHAAVVLEDTPIAGVARELGYFDAADRTKLAYVVYRPAKPARYPTVAWFDVYGAGSMPPLEMVRFWLDHGYAFAAASVRGTGCSHGEYHPFTAQEAIDGAAFVDWAGSQDWSSGKVGLIGSSQPGILQFGVAAREPRHLAAIAPGGTIRRIYADGWFLGGIYNASFATHWSRVDQPQASRLGAQMRIKLGDEACKAAEARIGPNGLLRALAERPFDGPFYQQLSPYDRAPEVKVPVLMVQSWTDPAIGSSAIGVFERLRTAHKRLFVLNGGHDAYLYSTAQDEVRRWMDHWVKGERNGIEREPRARIDFETRPTAAPGAYGDITAVKAAWTTTLPDWPAPAQQWRTLYLHGDGTLGDESGDNAERSYFYPSGTELPGSQLQFELRPLDWGALSYRSSPMSTDTAILGSPQLRLHVTSEQADTDFLVVLHDVSPRGEVTYLQRAYLRASHRGVDPERSTPQYVFHPHTSAEPVKPGAVYEVQLSIPPVAHLLRAGHALELLIAAPSPIPAPAWGVMPLMLPGFNTIHHGKAHPSQLRIPVVPGVEAQAPPPGCGELLFQPCRIEKDKP